MGWPKYAEDNWEIAEERMMSKSASTMSGGSYAERNGWIWDPGRDCFDGHTDRDQWFRSRAYIYY